MNVLDIINKKSDNKIISYDEIKYVIEGYLTGSVKDYEMSSLLMAIRLNGMTEEEIYDLTDVMINSGNVIDVNDIQGNVLDYHSTDDSENKVGLVLPFLLVSCGCKVAKIGDKSFKCINGFKRISDLDLFINQLNNIGVCFSEQIVNLVPVDEKIRELRNKTGIFACIPLIASSIMSRKIASGVNKILIDIKVGTFIKDIESARELANIMIKIGKKYNRDVICFITNAAIPIGNSFGGALEIFEIMDTLKGNGPKDLTRIVLTMASHLISMDKNVSLDEATKLAIERLNDGSAYNKFNEVLEAHQGDTNSIKVSDRVFSIKSNRNGFVKTIDVLKLCDIVQKISSDYIDDSVGIVLSKNVGDYVIENEEISRVYLNKVDLEINEVLDCFEISDIVGQSPSLIKEIVR